MTNDKYLILLSRSDPGLPPNSAVAGDTVIIMSNGVDLPYNETLIPRNSGTEDNWITFKGELSSDKPYIVRTGKEGKLCFVKDRSYVEIRDIIFKDAQTSHGIVLNNSHHITLTNLDISNIPTMTGILVNACESNIIIDRCNVSDIGNNGIALQGGPINHLHDTIVQNCTISNVGANDGITLHKDDKGNDIGSNHLIRNNVVSNCGEQGIDISSGINVIIEDNKTSNNVGAGIITGHGVQNIVIRRHVSKNENKVGIIINTSKNVELSDSFISNAKNFQVSITNCDTFKAKHNQMVSGAISTKSSVLVIFPNAKNIVFKNNVFLLTRPVDGAMLSYLKGATPENTNSTWDGNIWWNTNNNQKIIYENTRGYYDFDEFKELYAPNDEFKNPNKILKSPGNFRIVPQ